MIIFYHIYYYFYRIYWIMTRIQDQYSGPYRNWLFETPKTTYARADNAGNGTESCNYKCFLAEKGMGFEKSKERGEAYCALKVVPTF